MHSIRSVGAWSPGIAHLLATVVLVVCVYTVFSRPAAAQGGGLIGPFAEERTQSPPRKSPSSGSSSQSPTSPVRPVP